MIIQKQDQFWTKEEIDRLQAIRDEQSSLIARLTLERTEQGKAQPALAAKFGDLEKQAEAIAREVEQRYISERGKDGLLKDAAEIVDAIEKKDYLERITDQLRHIATLEALRAQDDARARANLEELRKYAVENYENCCMFITRFLRVQLNAFSEDEDTTEKIFRLVSKRARAWYPEEQPPFVTVPNATPANALALMRRVRGGKQPDAITGDLVLNAMGVETVIREFQETKGELSITTSKLLFAGEQFFIQRNGTADLKAGRLDYKVVMDFGEYAERCGYDIEAHTEKCATAEEEKKETRRAANARKDFKDQLKKDLRIMSKTDTSWTQKGGYAAGDFACVKFIGSYAVKDGKIIFYIDPAYGQYLMLLPFTKLPSGLWKIDGRDPNAFTLATKLSVHSNIYRNIEIGTANRLKVKTLLEWTNLSPIENIRKQRRNWTERIKDKFEEILERLHGTYGVLSSWKYTKANGEELTDAEAAALLDSYEVWEETNVEFVLKDAPDHSERMKQLEAEKKEHSERIKAAKQAKKKKKAEEATT